MTEKRFTIEIIEDKDVFIHQDGAMHFLGVNGYVNGGMVVDLLNNLYDENEQLKKDNKEYIRGLELSKTTSQSWASDVRELRKENYRLEEENEQLKFDLDYFKTKNGSLEKGMFNLQRENEQLKQRITELEKEVNSLSNGEADWLIDEML